MIKRIYRYIPQLKEVIEVTPPKPGEVNAPYVQGDEIPPTMSHATDEGRVFTSRSALYAHYREHGFECTGGDHLKGFGINDFKYKSNLEDIKADLHENYRKLQWGMIPLSEREKESCLREERNYRDYVKRQSR